MGIFENWPYTNYHDLNLNWVIGKIKDAEAAKDQMLEVEANTLQYSEDAAESARKAKDSEDAAALSEQHAKGSEDAAADSAALASSTVSNVTTQVNLLQARVDNIIPDGTQTAGNTELLDIRVGYDGETYASAGDAVRDQVSDIYSRIELITGNVFYAYTQGQYFDLSGATCDPVNPTSTANNLESVSVPCSEGDVFYITAKSAGNATRAYGFVDSSNNVIYAAPQGTYTDLRIVAPYQAAYLLSNSYYSDVPGKLRKGEFLRNEIDEINDNIKPYMYYLIEGSSEFDGGPGAIDSTTGLPNAAAGWKYTTAYTDVSGVDKIVMTMPTFMNSNVNGVAFYDSTHTYISGVTGRVTGTSGYEVSVISVPFGAKYMRVSFLISELNNFFAKTDAFYIQSEIDFNLYTKTLISSYGIQMFEKIGVIGDSIACGWALDINGNNSRRNIGISWPQQMARRNGCTAYNMGASGVDPIEWFDPTFESYQYCYPLYQSTGRCDMYIIGLGLNQGTLGTIADIDQYDYENNAATFYGQYARIIQMINDEHPDAIVVCLTEPTANISTYDQAVRDICSLGYINAELLDLENDYYQFFNTDQINNEKQPDGIHYTPYGYSLIAEAMMIALNDFIANNTNDFKYVGVETA